MSADDVRLIAAVGTILLTIAGLAGGLWYRMGRLEGRLDALLDAMAASQRTESEARRADTAYIVSRIDRLFELLGTAPASGDDD